ncbi:MAG: DNA repair protein RecO [bacterium]|nr:DNA repair protein RecO [bacterium]
MYGYLNAVVINSFDLGETDRVYVVFSDLLGRLSLIQRRGGLIKNPNSGVLNNFNLVRIFISREGNALNFYIKETELLDDFTKIKDSFEKFFYTGYILYVLNSIFKESSEEEGLYKLLIRLMKIIDGKTDLDLAFLKDVFLWKLSGILGYLPRLENCSVCSRELKEPPRTFSVSSGGLVCKDCLNTVPVARTLSQGSLNFIRRIFNTGINSLTSLRYTALAEKELSGLSEEYLRYYSDRDLQNSSIFLNGIKV